MAKPLRRVNSRSSFSVLPDQDIQLEDAELTAAMDVLGSSIVDSLSESYLEKWGRKVGHVNFLNLTLLAMSIVEQKGAEEDIPSNQKSPLAINIMIKLLSRLVTLEVITDTEARQVRTVISRHMPYIKSFMPIAIEISKNPDMLQFREEDSGCCCSCSFSCFRCGPCAEKEPDEEGGFYDPEAIEVESVGESEEEVVEGAAVEGAAVE